MNRNIRVLLTLAVCLAIHAGSKAQAPCDLLTHKVQGLLESYRFTLGGDSDPMSPVYLGRQFSNRSEYDLMTLGFQLDAAQVNQDSFEQFVMLNDSTQTYVVHDTRGVVLTFEDGTSLSYPNPLVRLSSVYDPEDTSEYPAQWPTLVGGVELNSGNIQKLSTVRLQSFTLAGHYAYTFNRADADMLLRAIQCAVAVRPMK